jgi:hypothetical protein
MLPRLEHSRHRHTVPHLSAFRNVNPCHRLPVDTLGGLTRHIHVLHLFGCADRPTKYAAPVLMIRMRSFCRPELRPLISQRICGWTAAVTYTAP